MKLKKYAVIGIMALLVIVGCDNKGNDKNNKDKVKVTNVIFQQRKLQNIMNIQN